MARDGWDADRVETETMTDPDPRLAAKKPQKPICWNSIWVALQELGAALRPVFENGDVPDWATALDQAKDDAIEYVEPRAMEEADDAQL